jgi:hypothetical protein
MCSRLRRCCGGRVVGREDRDMAGINETLVMQPALSWLLDLGSPSQKASAIELGIVW